MALDQSAAELLVQVHEVLAVPLEALAVPAFGAQGLPLSL
jgi:hypothetical protein